MNGHVIRSGWTCFCFGLLGGVSCNTPDTNSQAAARLHTLTSIDTVISSESGVLATVHDMAVGTDGTLWLADAANHRIVRVSPDHSEIMAIGRQGAGPGEFSRPSALSVSDSVVLVFDAGNRRVHSWSVEGEHLQTTPINFIPYVPVRMNASGYIIAPTLGQAGTLARLVTEDESTGIRIGTAKASMPFEISRTRIREQIERDEFPAEFSNNILPILSDDGSVWIVRQADGVLSRYTPDGDSVWSTHLPEDVVRNGLERFFAQWRDGTPGYPTPAIALDAIETGGTLWLLVPAQETDRNSILVLDGRDGRVLHRISMETLVHPSRLAIDRVRGRVYLLLGSIAAVVAAPLPSAVLPGEN